MWEGMGMEREDVSEGGVGAERDDVRIVFF